MDESETQLTLLVFPPINAPLVCCPLCFAAVPDDGEAVQSHSDWHVAAGRKVDRAGGFGAIFGGSGVL